MNVGRRAALACVLGGVLVLSSTACGGDESTERPSSASTVVAMPQATTTVPEPPPTSTCAPDERPEPPTPAPEPPSKPPDAPGVPASLRGAEWEVIPTSRKVVALTFDCGANADGIPAIIAALSAADAPATFFLTGSWARTFPEHARTLGDHTVGNHTNSHADLTSLGPAAIRSEVRRAERAIRETTGDDPRPLFRFPFGARDARTIGIVNELGYGSIRWTVDTLGWKGLEGGQTVASVRTRVLAALRPGAIVLMHVGSAPDGSTLDADALPSVVAAIRARGYRFVELGASRARQSARR
ncbi:MAG: polysaccharide deacetylase family protein [Gaiellaceae bacterium]